MAASYYHWYEEKLLDPAVDTAETVRLLAQSQDDVDPKNLSNMLWAYTGNPEGFEMILSLEIFDIDPSSIDDDRHVWSFLDTALTGFAKSSEWEHVVHILLDRGENLHVGSGRGSWLCFSKLFSEYTCRRPMHGPLYRTPLDELLDHTDSPFEGNIAAQRWLGLLYSHGYDVLTYLQEEAALHPTSLHLDPIASQLYTWVVPRHLVFELEADPPTVNWDWWTWPESSAFLLLEEFKWLRCLVVDGHGDCTTWMDLWPFDWLEIFGSSRHRQLYRYRQRLCSERLQRRQQKRLWKQYGKPRRLNIPGAWLE